MNKVVHALAKVTLISPLECIFVQEVPLEISPFVLDGSFTSFFFFFSLIQVFSFKKKNLFGIAKSVECDFKIFNFSKYKYIYILTTY